MKLSHFLLHPQKRLLHCHRLLAPHASDRCWPAFILGVLLYLSAGITFSSHAQAQAAATAFPVVITAQAKQASQSLTLVVTKFTDSNDGACDTDCSLREAIGAANRTPGRDEIHLASGVYSVTIPTLTDEEGDTIDEDANALGDLDIADDLLLTGSGAGSTIIAGSGATYRFGGGADRLFDILAHAHVTIEDLTIQHGRVSEKGGGLSNSGVLALNRVHLVDNYAASGFKIGHGGGIFNDGTLTVTNSLIANNRADGGEASYGQGGGIRNDGVMTLIQSTVRDNRVWDDNDYGIGGGILNRGTLRVERSTLSGNGTPGGPGGALANLLGGSVEVINSTLSGNSSGSGGGLANGSQWEEPGAVLLLHTTIANNRGGGLYNRGVTTATNTIIAGNPLDVNESPAALNCVNEGTFVTLGANVMGDGGNCPTTGPGDLTIDNTTVFTTLLHPLADNGGNTLTHALVTASVANDAANDATCADERIGGVDQRGVVRPQGARCDIGAYEAAVTTACTYPELVASDESTLRQAILCVNTAPAGVYTLTVTADIAYRQPMLPVRNPVITQLHFAGNGHTLDAQGHGRVLTLTNLQALTLHNLTLTGGQTDVNSNERDGGGVAFTCGDDLVCNWTVRNTTITDNHAYGGGGIDYYCAYHGNGTLLVQASVISNNSAVSQGGGLVYSSDEESGPCSLAIRHSIIEGNQAVDGGGVRIYRPRVTISDSTIRNNRATTVGGGLLARISDGFIDMTVQRTTISGNQAGEGGGGVYIASPDQTFDIQFVNSTISGNTVINGAGGGFYLGESNDSLRIALLNSTVTANASAQGAGVHVFHPESSFEMTGTLRLTNSLIADNLGSDCGWETAGNVPFSGQRVTSFGHNLDSDGTCLPEGIRQPSDLPNGNANLGPLADNGGATFTHALLAGSQALDAGDDAVCASEPVAGIDQRGVTRPQGTHCDIGAYEAVAQPVTTDLLFVSSRSSATAGGVPFRDEDILAYDFNTNTWQMIFDGSDVGITKDVDAFAFLADGSLLLSFNGPTTVPGLGAVDDSDLVQFLPTRLGSDTAGSFAWFLRGAAVGLTTDSEDIDAISFTADGHLVVSTIGDFTTPTVSGKDEDLIQLDKASGTWSLFFDGSTVGLANEDVNGLWIDPTNGDRYLTVKDSFAFGNVQIDSDDIFICTPIPAGGCTYRLFWDSDDHDYGSENIDSFHLGLLPARFAAGAQSGALEPVTPATIAEDDDADDQDVEDTDVPESLNSQIFLPLVER